MSALNKLRPMLKGGPHQVDNKTSKLMELKDELKGKIDIKIVK